MNFLTVLLLSTSFAVSAAVDPGLPKDNCDKNKINQAQADPGGDDAVKLARKLASAVEPDYSRLANSLCNLYNRSRALTSSSKQTILDFIQKHEGISNPTTADAIRLLNEHKNEMTCSGKHYLIYAFERGMYNEIILDLFGNELYSDDALLDFNAITMTYNPQTKAKEPMTVLDYINKVALKTTTISGDSASQREIKEIRELLVEEFGAKPFTELSLAERSAFENCSTH